MLKRWTRRLFGRRGEAPQVAPDEFLRRGHKLLHALLLQDQAFAPFGVGQGTSGDPVCIMSDDGSVDAVRRRLAEGCASGQFVSVALFVMADIEEENCGTRHDAVLVYVDGPGPGTTCRRFVSSYSFEDGEVLMRRPRLETVEERIAQ